MAVESGTFFRIFSLLSGSSISFLAGGGYFFSAGIYFPLPSADTDLPLFFYIHVFPASGLAWQPLLPFTPCSPTFVFFSLHCYRAVTVLVGDEGLWFRVVCARNGTLLKWSFFFREAHVEVCAQIWRLAPYLTDNVLGTWILTKKNVGCACVCIVERLLSCTW